MPKRRRQAAAAANDTVHEDHAVFDKTPKHAVAEIRQMALRARLDNAYAREEKVYTRLQKQP